jgi:hypothetical protein
LKIRYWIWVVIGACLLGFAVRQAPSCSVPVFRYALERWKPEPYRGVVLYRNSMTQQEGTLFRQLEQAAFNPDDPLNLLIRKIDVASFSEQKLKELLKGPVPEKLPVLAVWYPDKMGTTAPAWTIAFTPSIVSAFADSPKRRYLAQSLINGESVVWVFVPSGHAAKDESAKALIQREVDASLAYLTKMPFYILSGSKEKKLTYGFPILTLSRTDPKERFFLEMLLKSESDLYEHQDEPMVFPVFGRGRSLGCLFGEYISRDKVQGAISYLAASCSCEVKALNPGMDLLMAAPWDRVVLDAFVDDDTPMPELTGVMPGPAAQAAPAQTSNTAPRPELTKAVTAIVPQADPPTAVPPPPQKTSILATFGITLGSATFVVFIAGLILSSRRKRDQ